MEKVKESPRNVFFTLRRKDSESVSDVLKYEKALQKVKDEKLRGRMMERIGMGYLNLGFVKKAESWFLRIMAWMEVWREELQDFPFKTDSVETGEWRKSRKILVYPSGEISDEVLLAVAQGIESALDEFNLDMDIRIMKNDDRIDELISSSLGEEGGVVLEKVAEGLRKIFGKDNGFFIVMDKELEYEPNWGETLKNWGVALIAATEYRRRNPNLMRRMARHEMGHLVGYQKHHEDFLKCMKTVLSEEGYSVEDDRMCIMHWECPSDEFCHICKGAISYLWEEMERKDGKQYLKRRDRE